MINRAALLEPQVSYPRRQQFRRLSCAGTAAIGSATAALLTLAVAWRRLARWRARDRSGSVRGSLPRCASLGRRRACRLDRSPRSRAARDELSDRGRGAAVLNRAREIASGLGEDRYGGAQELR